MGNTKEMVPGFIGLGSAKIQKDLTFSNDTGTITLFTIKGDVIIKILPVIITDVVPNTTANIRMGVTGNTDALIVDTVSTELDARSIWVDQSPDDEIEPIDVIKSYIITNSRDVLLTLSAQVNSGAITFYCLWLPLSSDGKVVAA